MERAAVDRWLQVAEFIAHGIHVHVKDRIDHRQLIGRDALELIIQGLALVLIQFLCALVIDLIHALFPGSGRRFFPGIPQMQSAGRTPDVLPKMRLHPAGQPYHHQIPVK